MSQPSQIDAIAALLPTHVMERLAARARRAGLLDDAGRPDVVLLHRRAVAVLQEAGHEGVEPFHELATSEHDPDLALFTRASAAAAVQANPPRWLPHLVERLDLDARTRKRLQLRAEADRHPAGHVLDLATMASCAVTMAFKGVYPVEGALAAWIAAHPDPLMRSLCEALERARAATRPN